MSTELKRRNVPFSPPDMTDIEVKMVAEAILSGWITTGPKTKEFERQISEYVNTDKTVCLNSATAALEIALRLIGVGPEDEVIIPAYTYTATASVTQHVGCRLVMVDSRKGSWEMDYDKLAESITERTKVIIPVDFAGVICDYDKLFSVVESKKHLFKPANAIQKAIGRIVVSADCAHAFGSKRNGKLTGSFGDFSSFSFHAVKNMTTAEGGALTWNLPFGNEPVVMDKDTIIPPKEGETWNEFLYRKCQLYSLHGQNKDALAKTKLGCWEYDVIGPWYKCNMTDIMAAIGLAQMQRYETMLDRRREIVARYDKAFANCNIEVFAPDDASNRPNHHLYIVRLLGKTREQTNEFISGMAERGIACNVHFKPLPLMTAYKALGFNIADYPNAYAFFENEVTIPLHTKLSDEDVEYIISNFKDVLNSL